MNRSTLRRLVVTGATATFLLTATPALAAPVPRPAQPLTPPGLNWSEVDRPEQAETPDTGGQNKANSPNF